VLKLMKLEIKKFKISGYLRGFSSQISLFLDSYFLLFMVQKMLWK